MDERGFVIDPSPRGVFAPHVSSLGYGIFMVVYATQVWGGVFPFLPADFQTEVVTLAFYLSQSLAFCVAFVASVFGSYYFPTAARRMLVTFSTALVFAGSASVIAAMYVPALTLFFVMLGGIALGVGCAGMFMLWQRYFSSIEDAASNFRLILGTIAGAIIYFALHLIPIALTAFLIPVVLLPLCALCLTLSVREMDFDQPMFEDVPREHPLVYRRLLADFWRSALCVGALAFAAGLARGVAVVDAEVSSVVNVSSMAGALLGAIALLALWALGSFRFSLRTLFRAAYPIVLTGLLLFPFAKNAGLNLFAALTYGVFSVVQLVMMMQCAQIARDRGTNPLFAYSFFGAVAYTPQAAGFLLGWFAFDINVSGIGQVAFLSILAAYVLGMALFVSAGSLLGKASDGSVRRDDQIEFIALVRTLPKVDLRMRTDATARLSKEGKVKHADQGNLTEEERPIVDRLSKQCLIVQQRYSLSSRETEVLELIARGRSMAAIAEELFISENTVRTHSKHIYTKLDIHSRHELSDLVAKTDL